MISGRKTKTHIKKPSESVISNQSKPTKIFKTYDATSPKKTLVTKKPLNSVVKKHPRLLSKYLSGSKQPM